MNAVLKPSVLTTATKRLRDLEQVEAYIEQQRTGGNAGKFGEWIVDGLTNFSHDNASLLFEHIKQGNADAVLEMVTQAVVSYYAKNAGVKQC